MRDEDKNFGGSLVLDFRKWWRHVKTIIWQECRMKENDIGRWLEPITRSLHLSHIPITAFSQTDLFLVWIYHQFKPHGNLHGQMLTSRHDVDMLTWGRIVLSLLKRDHVHWNWSISRGKNI